MNPYEKLKKHEANKHDKDNGSKTIVIRLKKGEKYSGQFENNAIIFYSENVEKTEIFVNGKSLFLFDLQSVNVELTKKQSSFVVDIEAKEDIIIHLVLVELKKEYEAKMKKQTPKQPKK
jgi:hypothetical protein